MTGKSQSLLLAVAGLVAVVAVASFLLIRGVGQTPGAGADVEPDTTSSETGQTTKENDSENFVGTLAGIEFKAMATAQDYGCPEGVGVEDASEAQVAASPLRIVPTYLPPTYALKGEGAGACAGKVVSVGQYYVGSDGGTINIARFGGRVASAWAPRDRMETVTVGDKTAVLVKGLEVAKEPDVGNWRLIIPEDFGVTIISASRVSLDEVLKVAEGLE